MIREGMVKDAQDEEQPESTLGKDVLLTFGRIQGVFEYRAENPRQLMQACGFESRHGIESVPDVRLACQVAAWVWERAAQELRQACDEARAAQVKHEEELTVRRGRRAYAARGGQ